MSEKVNLKTLARDLNLSAGTVSRVLNGKAKEFRISEDTVNLVLDYAKKVGYSPNLLAKGLRASKTFTIGLMIPDIANPFFSIMAKNIEKAASRENYSILLVDAEENIEKEREQVRIMMDRKVDGIIAAPVGTSFEHFNQITNQNIPLIFVDRYFNESSIPYISSDNYQGGFEATNHLIGKGHKKIALIKGDEIIEPVKERRKGYEDALVRNGIAINSEYIVGKDFTVENGYKSTSTLLKLRNRPTAIIAMSNLIGLGVLKALKEYTLSVPQDVSLIIYDDQPYVSFLNPPATTVKQNSEEIGVLAVNYILSEIDGTSMKITSKKIKTELIERESVLEIK